MSIVNSEYFQSCMHIHRKLKKIMVENQKKFHHFWTKICARVFQLTYLHSYLFSASAHRPAGVACRLALLMRDELSTLLARVDEIRAATAAAARSGARSLVSHLTGTGAGTGTGTGAGTGAGTRRAAPHASSSTSGSVSGSASGSASGSTIGSMPQSADALGWRSVDDAMLDALDDQCARVDAMRSEFEVRSLASVGECSCSHTDHHSGVC